MNPPGKNNLPFVVLGKRIELLCQDWESCILTVRWTEHFKYLFASLRLRKLGDSNPRYANRARQFSKLLVSATHPNFLGFVKLISTCFQMRCKGSIIISNRQIFHHLFSCDNRKKTWLPRIGRSSKRANVHKRSRQKGSSRLGIEW